MGGVDLDAVETRGFRPRTSPREGRNGFRDALARHLLRHDSLVGDLEHRMRNGRRRHRHLAADVAPRMPAGVAELDRCLGAAAMDFVD